MTTTVDGLVSGLSTSALIKQLIAAERAPQNLLVSARDKAKLKVAAYQSVNTKLAGVRDLAATLADSAGWNLMKAGSSAPTVATATAGPTAISGSLTFTVNQLATASTSISAGTVSALTAVVTTQPLLVSAGGPALGVSTFAGNAGLTIGSHTITVTQASVGATKTATTALGATTAITAGVNDTLTVEVDGVAKSYTIAPNAAYSTTQLAAAVQTASNGDLKATVNATGRLVLTTVSEGAAHTLRLTGGTSLTALGLTGPEVGGVATAGVNGIITVDGTATTLTDVRAGVSASLPSGTGGSITAVLAGGLRNGTVTAKYVSTGDGTLSAVVNAVNTANAGVTAAAVQSAPGQYKLQLASTGTGLTGASSTATGTLTAAFGSFATLSTAQDSSITVGSGPSAFTVTSPTNQVSNVLSGVTLNLLAAGTTTVTVARDVDALASKVATMIDQANGAIADIKALTGYDAKTKVAGPLLGDLTLRQLQSKIVNAVLDPVATSTTAAAAAGISINKSGALTFDKTKFIAAYNANPNDVAALFQRGGTSPSADVTLATATHKTRAGAYPVVITQAAQQAEAIGSVVAGGTITAAETIDIRVGGATGTTITYGAAAGATLQSIADGLNALAATNNLGVLATVAGNALTIRSIAFGANVSFEVRTSTVAAGQTGVATAAGVYQTRTGVNVAGTIKGVVATGVGRLLQAPPADPILAGLTLTIASTPAQVTAAAGSLNLGNFTYVPGIAQRLATVGTDAVDTVSGTITTAVDGRNAVIKDLDSRIAIWDRRLADREVALKRKFADMEKSLGSLKQQSTWLAGQISKLNATR
jgi:flagellar hook-associated protein 2